MREIVATSDWLIGETLDRAGYRGLRNGQLRVLALIGDGNGSAAALAKVMRTSQQWVSKCVRTLLDQSCIELTTDPDDQRRSRAAVTERGDRALLLARACTTRFEAYGPASLEHDLHAVLADCRRDLGHASRCLRQHVQIPE